jgi:hypothetical protein
VGFGLIDDGHVSVVLKLAQMQTDQCSQLLDGIAAPADFFPEALENLLGFVAEKLDQDVVFVFKVQVDGPVGHAGLLGNFGNGRLGVSVAGKYLDGGIENKMVFVVFVIRADRPPPAGCIF